MVDEGLSVSLDWNLPSLQNITPSRTLSINFDPHGEIEEHDGDNDYHDEHREIIELKTLRFIHYQMLPRTLTFSLKKHSVRWYVQNGTKKVQFLNHFFTTFCVSNKECKMVSFSIYCLLGKNIEDIFDN